MFEIVHAMFSNACVFLHNFLRLRWSGTTTKTHSALRYEISKNSKGHNVLRRSAT